MGRRISLHIDSVLRRLRPSSNLCLALPDHGCQVPTRLAPALRLACPHPVPPSLPNRTKPATPSMDGSTDRSHSLCKRRCVDRTTQEGGEKGGRTRQARRKNTKYAARIGEGRRERACGHNRGCRWVRQMLKRIRNGIPDRRDERAKASVADRTPLGMFSHCPPRA